MTERRSIPIALILALFIGSGFAGLVYEIVWTRLFGLVMGNTTFSITTVLAAFMAGLALGSAWGGRRAGASVRPVRTYAILEASIGIYCLAVPHLIGALDPVCRALYRNFYGDFILFHVLLFLLGAAVLVPVTALMGATLPYLSRAVSGGSARLGTRLGDLYAANTIGAVAGALGAGFLLVPRLGVSGTNLLAVGVNLAVGALAWIVSSRWEATAAADAQAGSAGPVAPALGRAATWAVLASFGASGAISLAYQIAWTRALSMVIGMSTYAFTTIVGAFILGIAVGSAVFGRLADRTGRPLSLLTLCLVGIGLCGPFSPWVIGQLPLRVLDLYSGGQDVDFARIQVTLFGLLFALLFVPTALFGGAFPLATRALAPPGSDPRRVAPLVGRAYAANTLGAILGSVACGFVLLPWLQIQWTLRAAGGLAFACAVALVVATGAGALRRAVAGVAITVAGVIAVLLAPWWDQVLMGAGVYLYGQDYAREAKVTRRPVDRVIHERGRVLMHREGVGGTVQVKYVDEVGSREPPVLVLLVNGKPEATTRGDMRTQTLLGHLATIFHPAPRRGLVIGLGGGLTLASMASHGFERIDCLEISPAVAEAARREDLGFAAANRHVLDRSEVRLILGDGRTHVAFTDERYDVISSQPSNPWIAGVASLFTAEFFDLVHERLADGGLFCQWVQAYRMSIDDFRMIVRTFRSVFPSAWLFKTQSTGHATSGDFLLVGARGGATPSVAVVDAALGRGEVRADLASVAIGSSLDAVEGYVLGPEELASFAGRGPVNTDDNAHLEFSSPKSFYESGTIRMLEALLAHRGPRPAWWGDGAGGAAAAEARYRAMTELFASIVAWGKGDYPAALARAEGAVLADPSKSECRDFLVRLLGDRAQSNLARGRLDEAKADYERILGIDRSRPEPWLKIGEIFAGKGLYARAEESFRTVERLPGVDRLFVADAHANLAGLYFEGFRDVPRARAEIDAALAIDPEHVQALYIAAAIELAGERLAEACELLRRAVEAGGDRTDVLNRYADVLASAGRRSEAMEAYLASLELDPGQGVVHAALARLLFDAQDFDEALEHVERSRELGGPVDEGFARRVRQAAGR